MSENSNKSYLTRAFDLMNDELEEIKYSIHQTNSFLFFEWHTFSKEKLVEKLNRGKLYSIAEKMKNDIENWKNSKNFTFFDETYYATRRVDLDKKSEDIKTAIQHREPTFWEKFGEAISNFFTKFFTEYLPVLRGTMKVLGSFLNKMQKFLPFLN